MMITIIVRALVVTNSFVAIIVTIVGSFSEVAFAVL